MFEWFKNNDIGRKLQAAIEDVINGDGWGPFECLEKGEALVKVTLFKGQVIRFEKYRSIEPKATLRSTAEVLEETSLTLPEEPVEEPVKKKRKSRIESP